MGPGAGTIVSPGGARWWARGEVLLLVAGWAILLLVMPHSLAGDDHARFKALSDLLEHGRLSSNRYSMVGPLFSVPLWLLGKVWLNPAWWCARYNSFLLGLGMILIYRILRARLEPALIRRFLLLLLCASMFPHHVGFFGAETFTALGVGIGLLAVACGREVLGWTLVVLGALNTPAALPSLGLVAVVYAVRRRRWRYLVPPLLAAGLFIAENWIRRGGPLATGYEATAGFRTIMPYSGRPGFSYPFFFGLLSILFSFGKGLVFFASGIFLPVRRRLRGLWTPLNQAYWLWIWFLGGLVLVYARWWAWYGGGAWGPRFFLFAGIPAALAIAVRLHRPADSLGANLLTLVALGLSLWVGLAGGAFGMSGMEICWKDRYAWEALCWYAPEFSGLWRPFVAARPLAAWQGALFAYFGAVFLYLSAPLWRAVAKQSLGSLRGGWRRVRASRWGW